MSFARHKEGFFSHGRARNLVVLALLSVTLLGLVAAPTKLQNAQPATITQAPPTGTYFDHVLIIIMENEGVRDICGPSSPPCSGSSAPYLSSLAQHNGISFNYTSLATVSQPNYVGLLGGSTFNCFGGCSNITAPNLVDRIENAGLSWKGYMENQGLATGCDSTSPGLYQHEHNPFTAFQDIVNNTVRCNKIVLANPGSCSVTDCALINDLNSANAPNFMWLTPNNCDNMHGVTGTCSPSIGTGDLYLSGLIPNVLGTYTFTAARSALFVVFDEGNNFCQTTPQNNRDCVYAVWAGPQAVNNFVSKTNPYNHYSFLHTVENNWNLSPLNINDTKAPLMNEFLTTGNPPKAASWNPNVNCSPQILTVEQLLGNSSNSNGGATQASSPLNPGITSPLGANNAKSWLTNTSRTPQGWIGPGTDNGSCAHFVQIDGVQRGFFSETVSNNTYMPINGGHLYPSGVQNDTLFNIFTPGFGGCDFGNKTSDCMHSITAVIDDDWKAASYCGFDTTCDRSALKGSTKGHFSLIDVQGFLYWNPNTSSDPTHNYSGWEIHALTAWRKEGDGPSLTLSANPTSLLIVPGKSSFANLTLTGFNLFSGPVNLTATVSPLTGTPPTTSFNRTTVNVPIDGVAFSRLNVTTSTSSTGAYSITVTARNGTVTAPPVIITATLVGYNISATPSQLAILTGNSVNSTITLSSKGSFTGPVSLTVQSLCTCTTVSLGSTSLTLKVNQSNSTNLHITGSGNGDATIIINATSTSPAFAASTSVFVRVSDFGLTAGQTAVFVDAGFNGSTVLSLSSLNHFNGTITLSATTSNGGPLPSFNSTSLSVLAGQTRHVLLSFVTSKTSTYLVTVTAADSTLLSHQVPVTFVVQDFNVTAANLIQVNVGSTATVSLTIQGLNGFGGSIVLTDSVPSGLSCTTITPNTIPGAGTASVSCSATVVNNYNLTITGTSGPLVHSIHIIFNVVDFTISASSVSPTQVNLGSFGNSTITLTGLNGLTEKVALSFVVSSPGPTCSLSTPKVTLPPSPGTAILSCKSSSATSDFTVTVTGTNGTLIHTTASILFHIVDFTVTALPSNSLTLLVGQSASTISISLTGANSFSGAVNLGVIIFSAGPSATPNLASLNLHAAGCACNSTVLNVVAGSLAGFYTLNVTATNGQLTHFTIITLKVQDFSIGSNPAAVTILGGATGNSTLTVVGLQGFTGSVGLSPTIAPATGLTCALTHASIALSASIPNGTSVLSCSGVSGSYNVTITANGNGITHIKSVIYTVQDFTIAASPTSVTVFLGNSAQSTITLTGLQGFTGNVTLSASVSPPVGLTCTLSATSVVLNRTRTFATSALSCTDTLPTGSFTVTVTGASSPLSHTVSVTYTVGTAFTLTAQPNGVTTLAGASGNSTIRVTYSPTFIGTVSLTDTITPNMGLACSLNPVSLSATGNSTLTCSGVAGVYTVTVKGTSGSNTASANVTYTIQDFALSATPTADTVNSTVSGASTLTITPSNGFTGTVALSVTTNSTNLICTLTPTSVASGSGTSSLSCASSLSGNYLATVTGTSSSLIHFAAVAYHVQDFTITATPTSVTVNRGATRTSTINVGSLNGFAGNITLSVSTNSTNLTCSTAPTSVLGSGASTLSCVGSLAGNYLATETGTIGTLIHTTTVVVHVQDFSITANPPTVTVNAGTSGSSIVTISPLNGFTSVVSLSVATNSTGIICNLTPTSVLGGSGSSTLACSSAFAANYLATVSATNSTLSHSIGVTFKITDFTISATSPAAAVVNTSLTSTINVTYLNGFTGTVTITDAAPLGLVCAAISPGSVSGSGIITVSCSSTASGTYSLSITGTSGSLSHGTTATFTITDFTISATVPIAVNAGTASSSTLTLTAVNGFTGVVSLTDTIPSGLTCLAITPSSVSTSGSATVSCNSSVAGNYTLTITGTIGTLSHSATAVFTVRDFSITTTLPAAITVTISTTLTISVTFLNHFSGTVTITDTVPSGLTCLTITPTSLTSTGTASVSCSSATAGNYTLTLTGTSGSLAHSATATFKITDFTIVATSPGSVIIGASATSTITLAAVNGFAGTIALTDSVPSALTCIAISPSSIVDSGTATVSCNSPMAGNYTLTLTGTSGTLAHSTTAIFRITDFTISASSPSANVNTQATSTIAVTSLNGFAGVISLTDTVPSGLICSPVSPTSVTNSGLATVSCSAANPGTYSLSITGTSGTLVHSTTATFTVSSLTVTASSPSPVPVGTSAMSTITVTYFNGFSGTVSLTDTVPAGLTCGSISPSTFTTNGTATVSCSSAVAGNYTLTITGSSGSVSVPATAVFKITDFAITASTSAITPVGTSATSTITIVAINHFTGTVALTDSVSTGLSCSAILPPSLTNSGTATVSCSSTVAGNYTLTITGTGGSDVHPATATFQVTDFTIAGTSPSAVLVNTSTISTITLSAINHFSGAISLTDTVPTGLTCGAISPTSLAGSGTATVSCQSTTAGSYVLTITGTSGSTVHAATATFTVTDFTMAASSPGAVLINSSATSAVTITAVNGFAGVVSLTDTVPAGLTCGTISPTSVTSFGTATVSCQSAMAGTYVLTVTSTSGTDVHTATATFTVQDFSISASPPATVLINSSTSSTISVTALNGFAGVALLTDTVPSGLTCVAISPASVTGSGTATVSCQSATPGNYVLTLTATSGTDVHVATATFTITDFTIAATSPASINVGTSVTSTITLSAVNGFTGSITLSDILPSGLACLAISPTSVTNAGTATVSCSSSLSGNYTLTLTGTSGSLAHSTTATFRVTDFSVSASSPSATNVGTQATSIVTITPLNGFTGTISLSDLVPTGLTCGGISPTSVTNFGSATVSCSASNPGTYALIITGTSGTIVHSTTATFTVTSLTLAASSPTPVTVGTSAASTITVTYFNGFTGTVSLTDTIPSGLACGLISPSTFTTNGTAIVSCSSTVTGNYTLTINGSSGSVNVQATTVFKITDFTIVSSIPPTVTVGTSTITTITLTALNHFIGSIALTDTVPSGLSCSLITPSSLTNSGTATISCSSGTATTYILSITATSGTLLHSTTATFTITDFTITATSPAAIFVGTGASSGITVTALNGFTGTVSLTGTVPTGLTCNPISPIIISNSGTASVLCSATVAGTYQLTITGTSGSVSHLSVATFTVTDFSISTTSSNPIAVTTSVISTVTVTALNGFTGTVTLTASVPSGLSCGSVSPSTVANAGSATLSCSSATAGNYTVTITGTSGSLSHAATAVFTITDFSITASSPSAVYAGTAASSTITVTALNKFTGTINITDTVPSGLTCGAVSPASVTNSGTASISCSAAVAGTYFLVITGASGSLSHGASATFTVTDFTISATSPAAMNVGVLGASAITVSAMNGFIGTVSLIDSIPAGLTCNAISPSNVVNSGAATVSCNSTTAGNYTLTITSTSGTLSHSTTLTFRVQDFTLAASPTTVTLNAGTSGSSTSTVTPTNGFSGTVTLALSTNSTNLTCTIVPTSITGGSGTATLSCSASPKGNYLATVTATSGSLSHTATVIYHVQDFMLTANPTSVTVNVGTAGASTVTVSGLNSFAGVVSFSTNSTCTTSPTSVTGSGSATLSCTFAVAGTVHVTVTATNAGLSHTSTVTFVAQNFALTASPLNVNVDVGFVGPSTITVTSQNGFGGVVGFTTNSTSCTAPASVTGSGTSSLSCTFTSTSSSPIDVVVTGTSGSLAHSVSVVFTVQDFTISASPTAVTVNSGQGGPSTITISPISSFASSVTLTVVSNSTNLTCATTPASILGGGGTSTLSCSSTVAGNYLATVTGSDTKLSHAVTVTYHVQDFIMSASPTSLSVIPGTAGQSTIATSALNGFAGTVSLAATSNSTNLLCTLSLSTISSGSGSSTLFCTGSKAGNYLATVTGTVGPLSHTTGVVFAVSDFAISAASPAAVTVVGSAQSTITVTALNGFTGTVSLTDLVQLGLTCTSISPSTITGSGAATITCSSTSAGTYSITVTGSSGTLSHSAVATITVTDFSISATSPSPVDVTVPDLSTITVTYQNGFAGTISLTDNIPTGLSCSAISPGSVSSSNTASVSCTSTIAGTYSLSVTGTSGTLSHTATATFSIQDFSVTANPTSLSGNQNSALNSTITIAPVNGFVGTVSLGETVSPSTGITCTLSPSTIVNGSGNSTLSCTATVSQVYTVTVAATSGPISHSTIATYSIAVPDFSIVATPTSVSTDAGVSVASTITIQSLNGFTGTVSLSSSISPSGPTCGLSPTSLTLGTSTTSTLSCSGLAGSYVVTVTGTSTLHTHIATVALTIQDYTIASSPSSVTTNAGSAGTSAIVVNSVLGFTGTVSISTSTLPTIGIACSVSPATATLGSTATSTLSCIGSAGTYTVTVTGASGSLSHSTTVSYLIQDYSISANPTTVTVLAGSSGTSTITLTGAQGFSGTIALSSSISPTGLTCSLFPISVSISGAITSATSTLSCSGPAGLYAITVTGTSASLSHSTIVNFVVQDFTISTSPSSVSALAGVSGTATVTVSGLNGFTGSVSLTTTILPSSGLTCSLSLGSISLSSTTTGGASTLSCTGSAGLYSVQLTGTSNSLSRSASITYTIQDFTVSASPTSLIVFSGGSQTSTVTVNGLDGFSSSVNLAPSVAPPTGMTCSLNPTSVTLGGQTTSATSVLTCNDTATTGSFSVTITATSGALVHTANVVFTVATAFSVSASPTTITSVDGTSASSTITVSYSTGFTGTVTLTDSISSGTLACSLTTTTFTTSGTSILLCSGLAGVYSVTTTGTSGANTATATITYTVQDFSLVASPTSVTTLAGSSGFSTIVVSSLDGLTGTVALSQSVSPIAGLNCALTLTSITLTSTSTSGTSSLSCSGSAGVYVVTVTGTGSGLTHTATVNYTVQDFTISASPTAVTTTSSSLGASTVTLAGLDGYTGTVALAYSVSPPSGLTCSIPAGIALSSATTSAIATLSCSGSQGAYVVTVTATSNGLTHAATVAFTIQDFTLGASPTSVMAIVGNSATSTITASGLQGFVGTLSLSATVSPSTGLTCTLTPVSIALSGTTTTGTSTLSCQGSAGIYTVTVTGISGLLTHIASVALTVQDFTITSSPTSVTANAGTSAPSTIVLTSLNGFTGTVSLSSVISPATGLACTLSPNVVTLGLSGTSTLSCSGTTGVYTVSVTGTSNGIAHLAQVTFTIQDFTISADTTNITFVAGTSVGATITTTGLQGFTGSVGLSTMVSPAGLSCSLSQTSISLSSSTTVGTSSLSCSGTAQVYTVIVTAIGNGLSHGVTLTFTVQDFTVAASPTSIQAVAGAAGASTITLTGLNGYTSTVSLTSAISPSTGLACTLTPTAGALSTTTTSTTSTLSCNGLQGVYSVTVTGSIGSLTHSSTIMVTIQDYTVSASPASTSALAGAPASSSIVVTPQGGFTGTVTLSDTGSPTGLTCTLSQASLVLGPVQTSLLSCSGPAGTYTVFVTGASGSLSHSTSVIITVTDFAQSANPTSLAPNIGVTATSTITISALNGFSGSVSLSASTSPSTGLACTLSPTSVPGLGTSTLSCTPTKSGSYTVTVTGSDGSLSHSASVDYSVGVPDYSVNASPTNLTVAAGVAATSTLSLTAINGFSGTVTLTDLILPSTGLTCTLNPTSVTLGALGTSTLSCTGVGGLYTVTVTGASGSLARQSSISITVQDFSVTASPTTVNTLAGASATSTITVAPIQNFTGTIPLTTVVSPSGLTCTLTPTSVGLGVAGTSALSCSGTQGTYTVSIAGTSGSITRSSTVNVIVQDFIVAASPTSVTLPAGASSSSTLTISSLQGFSGTVSLTVGVIPAGPLCNLTPSTVSGSGTSTLSCSGSAGSYTVTLRGASGILAHSAIVVYTIQDFTVTANTTPVTVNVGSSGSAVVTIGSLESFAGIVSLVTNSTSCGVAPTTVSGSGTATLACTLTAHGTFHVGVTGASGGLTHSATVTYVVQDFTIAASPTSATVNAGAIGSSIVSVGPVDGFSSAVSLTVIANSTSLVCSLSSPNVIGSGSSSLTCTGSAAGNYLATVTGTIGSLSHSTTFTVSFLKSNPVLTTTLAATTVPVGGSVSDSAALSNVFHASGTVSYEYFAGEICLGPATAVGTPVVLVGSSVPNSNLQTFNLAGNYSWNAFYSGDANNAATTSSCESLSVNMASPTLTLSVSDNSLSVGGSVTLTAGITSGFQASGTATYDYVMGSTCPASGPKAFGTASVTDGTISSLAPITIKSAGVYRVFAAYSGDQNNVPAMTGCQVITVAPVLQVPGTITVTAGATVHFTVNATDLDGTQAITITLTGSNTTGATFTSAQSYSEVSSAFTWASPSNLKAGTYVVTITAEANGVSKSQHVVIHVNAAAVAAPLPYAMYSLFGIIGFAVVLSAAVLLRRFQNPTRKMKLQSESSEN